jgi:hypothetical protein
MKALHIGFIIFSYIFLFAPQNVASFSVIKVGSLWDSWTIEEQKNAIHFTNADKAYIRAVAIMNDDRTLGKLQFSDGEEFKGLLRNYKLAASEARMVKDSVLDKIHPQMKINFRTKFQKAAELMVQSLETRDMNSQIRGVQLHGAWVDWWNSNKKQIKIRTYKEKKAWEFWK